MSDNTNDDFDFSDLTPRQLKFEWKGVHYILQEAGEGAATSWENARIRSAKWVDGKLVEVTDPASLVPLLVGLCLFKTVKDKPDEILFGTSTKAPVTIDKAELDQIPSRHVKRMFEWIKKNSNLEVTETEESISKEIVSLQKKLEERKGKNSSPSTDGISVTANE
jgi:hypothetical protein